MFRHLLFCTGLFFSTAVFAESENFFDLTFTVVVEDADGKELKSFTVEQLKSDFPQHVYETRTPWTYENTTMVFRGPMLDDVLKHSGFPESSAVKVTAYDDFVSVMPSEIIKTHKPMLAVERLNPGEQCAQTDCEGETRFRPIEITDKGPVMFVWPFERLVQALPGEYLRFWVFSAAIFRAEK